MAFVSVVVVSYNCRDELRACVEPFLGAPDVKVTIVDNASADGTLDAIADLPLNVIPLQANRGFAYGCNVGWRSAHTPFVLFLNPDATMDERSLRKLVAVLQQDDRVGAVAPKIVAGDGSLDHSQRRFPRLVSTYAQALFLHRFAPRAAWFDEVVRVPEAYERRTTPEWVSGACILVRRDLLERLEGLDESFFMYCEDIDLCRRIWDAGYEVRFEPEVLCIHGGGGSAPRPGLLPMLAASRVRYAGKHRSWAGAAAERAGIALGALTHMVLSTQGKATRSGHRRAFRAAVAGTGGPRRGARVAAREHT